MLPRFRYRYFSLSAKGEGRQPCREVGYPRLGLLSLKPIIFSFLSPSVSLGSETAGTYSSTLSPYERDASSTRFVIAPGAVHVSHGGDSSLWGKFPFRGCPRKLLSYSRVFFFQKQKTGQQNGLTLCSANVKHGRYVNQWDRWRSGSSRSNSFDTPWCFVGRDGDGGSCCQMVGTGFMRPTPLCRALFSPTVCAHQKQLERNTRSPALNTESSWKRALPSSSSISSPDALKNTTGVSMTATAAALENTRARELMDDRQVAAAASKLLKLLAPVPKGTNRLKSSTPYTNPDSARPHSNMLNHRRQNGGTSSVSVSPSQGSEGEHGVHSSRAYLTPPPPLANDMRPHAGEEEMGIPSLRTTTHSSSGASTNASLASVSTSSISSPFSSFTPPSDLLFKTSSSTSGDAFAVTGFPSRRPRIPISKWQQQEFEEAFEAAEAVLQEEEREARERKREMKRKRKQKGPAFSGAVKGEEVVLDEKEEEAAAIAPLLFSNEAPITTSSAGTSRVDCLLTNIPAKSFTPFSSSFSEVLPGDLQEAAEDHSSVHTPTQFLANPFKGLHEHLYRSYRLDEVLQKAQEEDLVFAKQEPKAAVFSFFTLRGGLSIYRQHWNSKEAVRQHHENLYLPISGLPTAATRGSRIKENDTKLLREKKFQEEKEVYVDCSSSSSAGTRSSKTKRRSLVMESNLQNGSGNKERSSHDVLESSSTQDSPPLLVPRVRVGDSALRWGGLGWEHPGVEVDYSLLIAQRLLLFPPEERFFHALIGRNNVPCDFFADLDLPECTIEEGEKTLVEVLDYLEVRLPGVGFTDPFFLVLTNEEPEEMWHSTSGPPAFTEESSTSVSHCPAAGIPIADSSSSSLAHNNRYSSTRTIGNKGKQIRRKKVSYHIHARSMTHVLTREERSMEELRKVLRQSGSRKRVSAGEEKKRRKIKRVDDQDAERNSPGHSCGNLEGFGKEEEGEGVIEDVIVSNEWTSRSREERAGAPVKHKNGKGDAPLDAKTGGASSKSVKGATKMIAFQDYRVVKLIADEINQTLGFNALDEGCYRTSGSLRCAFSRKIPPAVTFTPVSPANAAAAVSYAQQVTSKGGGGSSTSSCSPGSSHAAHKSSRGDVGAGKGVPSSTEECRTAGSSCTSLPSPSFSGLQPALVPLRIRQDQHPDLQRKLHDMHNVLETLTAPEILELTFCTRHLPEGGIPTLRILQEHLTQRICFPTKNTESIFKATTLHQFKVVKPTAVVGHQNLGYSSSSPALSPDGTPLRPPVNAGIVEYDAYGNAVSPYLTEAAKWRRFKAVVKKLESIPPRAALSFDIWVRVGLALHNFSNEEHVFEEWVKFSVKCPQKFSREACRKKWLQFERNPDALNWRRGFNYLNQTIWRQL